MYLKENEDLTRRNSFGFTVHTACLAVYDSAEELKRLLESGTLLPAPWFPLGEGSNLVLTADWPGTLFYSRIKEIELVKETPHEVQVRVGSGVIWDDFCRWACGHRYWGIENLSMIPGQTGAAAVQNIGAYGMEVQESILRVECLSIPRQGETSEKRIFFQENCRYGYRDSFFKKEGKGRYIVTAVVFRLGKQAAPRLDYGNLRECIAALQPDKALRDLQPEDIRNAVLSIRKEKLPAVGEIGSAGSFFKNPVVSKEKYGDLPHYPVPGSEDCIKVPAAWLIDRCGWKGYRKGDAGVWHKQPLILVNHGSARPQEIIELEKKIMDSVYRRFGIVLEPEAEHLPPLGTISEA